MEVYVESGWTLFGGKGADGRGATATAIVGDHSELP